MPLANWTSRRSITRNLTQDPHTQRPEREVGARVRVDSNACAGAIRVPEIARRRPDDARTGADDIKVAKTSVATGEDLTDVVAAVAHRTGEDIRGDGGGEEGKEDDDDAVHKVHFWISFRLG